MKKIGDVKCHCISCDWQGIINDCEPDVDSEGSLGCPKCMCVITHDSIQAIKLEDAKRKFRNLFFGVGGFLFTRKENFDNVIESIIDAATLTDNVYYMEYVDADHVRLTLIK